MRKKLLLSAILVSLTCLVMQAQNNIPDTLFAKDGVLEYSTTDPSELLGIMLRTPDGKIVCGGYDFDNSLNAFYIDLLRFDVCGTVDSGFGIDGKVRYKFDQRNTAYAFAVQPDNKIICGGLQAPSNAGSEQFSYVCRFNSDGSPDSSFNGTGTNRLTYSSGSPSQFNSVHVLPDGRIICMGNNGFTGFSAMRFLANGTLDATFNGDGQFTYQSPAFAGLEKPTGHVLPAGKILITSVAYDPSFNSHFAAIQVDSTGRVDSTYGNSGVYFSSTVPAGAGSIPHASALTAGNQLVIAGNIDVNGIDIIRVTPEGIIDSAFGVNGRTNFPVAQTTVKGLTILANGSILVHGAYPQGFGIGFIIMLKPNGAIDSLFGTNGLRLFYFGGSNLARAVEDLIELPDGSWLSSTSSFDFVFMKTVNQSNVPHITETAGTLSTTGTGIYQWYFNDTLIAQASQSTLSVSQKGNGSYTVLLTSVDGCSYLSDSLVVTDAVLSGISHIEHTGMVVFPNPAKYMVTIKTDLSHVGSAYTLTDPVGRIVLCGIIASEAINLNISNLATGVYWLKTDQQMNHPVTIVKE